MIKNLSRSEYYKDKKLPLVVQCRRLEPEPPVRTHLLETLPDITNLLDRLRDSAGTPGNRTNLELANAVKIIHELEEELEIVTTRCGEQEEELHRFRNVCRDRERAAMRLEEKILQLENEMQKLEFGFRNRLEGEKDNYGVVLAQYEKKIEEMGLAYAQLKHDREREIEKTEVLLRKDIDKANHQIKQFESIAESGLRNFKKQLEKATQENTQLRQKITDLETVNQQQLRDLQKNNSQLSQNYHHLKLEYQHKLLKIQAELELTNSRIKQLTDTSSLLEKRIENERRGWQEEKAFMTGQFQQSEISWKASYTDMVGQKDKAIEELQRRGLQLGEKERQESFLKDRISKLERQVVLAVEERNKLEVENDRMKQEINQKYKSDYEIRINDLRIDYERQISQCVTKALEQQRKSSDQKYKLEINRYLEKLKISESEKMQSQHNLRVVEEERRKLQVQMEQQRIELDYKTKTIKQQSESFRFQFESLRNDYETRISAQQQDHTNEINQQKQAYHADISRLKETYEQRIQQLSSVEQVKTKKLDQTFRNQKIGFVQQIQGYEVANGRLRAANEELIRSNKQLENRLAQLQIEVRNYKINLQHEANIKDRLSTDISAQLENSQRLKDTFQLRSIRYEETIKKMDEEIFELRRTDSMRNMQLESLGRKIQELESKNSFMEKQKKQLEDQTAILHKRLNEHGTVSEKWKIFEQDFSKANRRLAEQYQQKQKQLLLALKNRQAQLQEKTKKILQLDEVVFRAKRESDQLQQKFNIKRKQLDQMASRINASDETVHRKTLEKEEKIKQLNEQIGRLESEKEDLYRQSCRLNKQLNDINVRCGGLEYDRNVLIREKAEAEQKIKEAEKKIQQMEEELQRYRKTANKKVQQQSTSLTFKFEAAKQQLEAKLGAVQNHVSHLNNVIKKLREEKEFAQQKLQQARSQYQRKHQQGLKAVQKISWYHTSNIELAEKLDRLNQQINQLRSKEGIMIDQIARLRQVNSQNSAELNRYQEVLRSDREKLQRRNEECSTLTVQSDNLRADKENLERKLVSMGEQNEMLSRKASKSEQQIMKIYEECEARIKAAQRQELQRYESIYSKKVEELELTKAKLKKSSDQQIQHYKLKSAKMSEQKTQLYREVAQKNSRISQLTIEYQSLTHIYEQLVEQLQIYKRKWSNMFSEFSHTNNQLNEAAHKNYQLKSIKRMKTITELNNIITERLVVRSVKKDEYSPATEVGGELTEHMHGQPHVSSFEAGNTSQLDNRTGHGEEGSECSRMQGSQLGAKLTNSSKVDEVKGEQHRVESLSTNLRNSGHSSQI